MIDEVDSASNNRVFIDFLAQLRKYYLDRDSTPTFYSVILAGVYDIRNLKLKLRPDEEHQYNSPWNIAARFTMDMSFSVSQISVMLSEYEMDHQTGMDIETVALEIYQYTSGYPYLVSAICKYLDEEVPMQEGFAKISDVWTKEGITEAVKILLKVIESYGRKFFLLYLKPIINGTGNYYIEAQTRDSKRTDVIIDYLGEQFIVEMKIWHGNEYNERGEQQLADYLDYFHQKKGYMLSFNFNKKKETGVKTIILGDKVIVEAVV